MRALGDVAVGRDNHFNLIRFLAAAAVLVSHGTAIVLGDTVPEPLEAALGHTLGEVAVDVFFASSGFLVCGSLMRLQAMRPFWEARALRIFPGLVASLVIVALLVGPAVSQLGAGAYLASGETWTYLARNAVLFLGIQHTLPGVFETLPLQGVVNGSLWTLPFEVWCYAMLAIAWAAMRGVRAGPWAFSWCLALAAAGSFALFDATRMAGIELQHGFRLSLMFFAGAWCFTLRDRLPMSGWIAAVCVASMAAAGSLSHAAFAWVYSPSLVYLVLYAAYVPKGPLLRFNALGDYSYGLYIYAFPTQQLLRMLLPELAMAVSITLTFGIALLAAFASWHLLEKPCLALKRTQPASRHPGVDTSGDRGEKDEARRPSRARGHSSSSTSSSAITIASSRPRSAG